MQYSTPELVVLGSASVLVLGSAFAAQAEQGRITEDASGWPKFGCDEVPLAESVPSSRGTQARPPAARRV